MTQFTRKNRTFLHIEGCWCVRETKGKWQVYHGLVIPGAKNPSDPTRHSQAGEFPTKEQAIAWVHRRREL